MAEDDNFTATGPGLQGFFATNGDELPFPFGGVMFGRVIGLLGFCGHEGLNQKNGYSFFAGVEGVSDDHTGVAGVSLHSSGVFGQTEDPAVVPGGFLAGVVGAAETQQGVIGFSRGGDGAQGLSFTGTGVRAVSFFGPAVNALSGALSGVTGISGTQGPVFPDLPAIAGVVGSSDEQPGLMGISNENVGLFGISKNNVGVFGRTSNPASFAGIFSGNVFVGGTLTATVKNAVVPFPDGSQRVLHCMESPEHWFEDIGAAKLARGRAVVKLDADFAKVVKLADYHIFVTPEGDCRGLYVRRKNARGFEVRELGGGKSSVAFSYRIVGRRKDIKAHRRFAKFDTRPPIPTKARPPRKPTAAALRTFVAGLEKEARARAPKKGRAARMLPKDVWSHRAPRRRRPPAEKQ